MGCSSSKQRLTKPRAEKTIVDRINVGPIHVNALEMSKESFDTDFTVLESSETQTVIDCKANDRISLQAAIDQIGEESNHSSWSEKSIVHIVRSDKLSFSGTGIRRHSRRKRNRHKGCDDTRIVVLCEKKSIKEAVDETKEEAT